MNDLHARPMRGGGSCQLENGHRGRCASVARECTSCGKRRRGSGTPYEGEWFCFMCVGIYTARRRGAQLTDILDRAAAIVEQATPGPAR